MKPSIMFGYKKKKYSKTASEESLPTSVFLEMKDSLQMIG